MILLDRPVGKITVLRAWVGFVGLLGLVAGLHALVNQRSQFVRTHVHDLQPSEGELIIIRQPTQHWIHTESLHSLCL